MKKCLYITYLLSIFCFPLSTAFPDIVTGENVIPAFDGHLNIYALPIGQGDCTVVQCPNGNMLIVDMGQKKVAISRSTRMEPDKVADIIFNDSKVKDIYIVITHPDADHMNLFRDVWGTNQTRLDKVKKIVVGFQESDYKKHGTPEWFKRLGTGKLFPVHTPATKCYYGGGSNACANAGEIDQNTVCEDNIHIDVIGANYGGARDPNANSIVLKVWAPEAADVLTPKIQDPWWSVVLTGDFESSGPETDIVDDTLDNFKNPTVYKLAHHGACAKANSEKFLKEVNAKWFFVSSAYPTGGSYWHPTCKTMETIKNYGATGSWNLKKFDDNNDAPEVACGTSGKTVNRWKDTIGVFSTSYKQSDDSPGYRMIRFKFPIPGGTAVASPVSGEIFAVDYMEVKRRSDTILLEDIELLEGIETRDDIELLMKEGEGVCPCKDCPKECDFEEGGISGCGAGNAYFCLQVEGGASYCEDCINCRGDQSCIKICGCFSHSDCRSGFDFCAVNPLTEGQRDDLVSDAGICTSCFMDDPVPIDGDRSICNLYDPFQKCRNVVLRDNQGQSMIYNLDSTKEGFGSYGNLLSRKFVYVLQEQFISGNEPLTYMYFSYVWSSWVLSRYRGYGEISFILDDITTRPATSIGAPNWISADGNTFLTSECIPYPDSWQAPLSCDHNPFSCKPDQFCARDNFCAKSDDCLMNPFVSDSTPTKTCPPRGRVRKRKRAVMEAASVPSINPRRQTNPFFNFRRKRRKFDKVCVQDNTGTGLSIFPPPEKAQSMIFQGEGFLPGTNGFNSFCSF